MLGSRAVVYSIISDLHRERRAKDFTHLRRVSAGMVEEPLLWKSAANALA